MFVNLHIFIFNFAELITIENIEFLKFLLYISNLFFIKGVSLTAY